MTTTHAEVSPSSKKPGSVGLYRAVLRGDMTAAKAGEELQEMAAPTKVQTTRSIPSVLWSLLVIIVGALFLPVDRR